MKVTSIVLALSAIVLTACVAPEPIDFDLACRNRTTTLNHVRNSSISHTHPTVEMCQGFTLTIRVVPPVDMDAARSESPQGNWLNESADDGRNIVIDVPNLPDDDVVTDAEFKYTLTVDGIGSLDPTIRIIR